VRAALRRREELTAYEERRMEALKQRILTVLHHEFRTPLSYIVAYADLMASTPSFKHSEELHQYIQGILRGSERLTSLIDSFLILAELESGYGRQVYERRNAVIEDLNDVLSEIIGLQKLKADEQDVELQLNVSPTLPPTSGDLTYLRSAFKHLVDNAIKFSPRGVQAVVKVEAVEEDGFIVVSVTDEGPGIAEEEQDRLFDTFYQVNREKNEQQGAGAGLAITRHVAELHGGSIEVESQPGHGSRFMMRLPGVDLLEPS
jgi:two-component system sensor histidine kinase SenX3